MRAPKVTRTFGSICNSEAEKKSAHAANCGASGLNVIVAYGARGRIGGVG